MKKCRPDKENLTDVSFIASYRIYLHGEARIQRQFLVNTVLNHVFLVILMRSLPKRLNLYLFLIIPC